jgi:ligand-binding sensor domain-containing protein
MDALLIVIASVSFFSCNDTGSTMPVEENVNIVIQDWRIYDAANSGLPDNQTRALAVDNQNNVWVGTFGNGIGKFDGNTWTLYNTRNSNLPSDEIWCLAVDRNNNVWIGTTSGLAKYDRPNWEVYDTTNSPLPYHSVLSLAVDKENILWIGCGHATGGGVLSFDGNNWRLYTTENSLLPSGIINVIHVDEQNNKWIGTGEGIGTVLGGGLVRIDAQGSWSVFTKTNSGMLYYSATAITADLDGNIWIGNNALLYLQYGYYHGALLKFDGTSWTDFRPNPNGKYDPAAIVSNRVDEIACDKYGYLWIATEAEWKFNYNLSVFRNGVWKNVTDLAEGFPHPFIRDIKIDRYNKVWLATQLGVISISYSPK